MTGRARVPALAAVLASAALLVPLATPEPATAGARTGVRTTRMAADSVAVRVDDISPVVLPATTASTPLTVRLTLTNNTERDIDGISVAAERGEPADNQAALDASLAKGAAPAGHVVPVEPTKPVTVNLPAGTSQQVVFASTTSTLDDRKGLCNCSAGAVYPLFLSAHVSGPGGVDQVIGLGSTYVSSFYRAPAPVRVTWVWPLVDQPHLLNDTSNTTASGTAGAGGTSATPPATPVFTDDFLAASVGTGGRLDRSLQVLERVAAAPSNLPLTVVVDPELLDELQIMATTPYRVRSGARLAPGGGKDEAAAWLARLQAVLAAAPQFRVELTPYADPDVQSLHANHLSWSTTLPAAMRRNVTAALGGSIPPTTLDWPANGVLAAGTLGRLVDSGVGTVLLNRSAVTPRTAPSAVPSGLARISARGRDIAAGLLDPALEKAIARVVGYQGSGTSALPGLMAQLGIRAAQEPTTEHVAVLAPPRWVDPSVDGAVRAIETTSASVFAQPIPLAAAVGGELLPTARSRLAPVPAGATGLPSASLGAAQQVEDDVPGLTALLTPARPAVIDPQAKALLAELPLEAQRATASAWALPGNAKSATAFATALTAQVDSLTHGVSIVVPSSGSYTLASSNSPLPITLANNLPYQVTVMVRVTTANGLPGFSAKPETKVVGAHQKLTLHLPAKVDRSGRIRVVATLATPDGRHQIGDAVQMTVRSTALGVIGVVITIGAGAVLLLALVIRFGRRLRSRYRRPQPTPPLWDPDTAGEAPLSRVSEPRPVERAP